MQGDGLSGESDDQVDDLPDRTALPRPDVEHLEILFVEFGGLDEGFHRILHADETPAGFGIFQMNLSSLQTGQDAGNQKFPPLPRTVYVENLRYRS
jgi:hypothetical protein